MNKIPEHLFRHGRWLTAIGAGLLLALAFPKLSLAGFAWIAPALMLAAAHGKSGRESFRLGYVSGLAFWLTSLYWLLLMPATGFPILGWLALAAFVALFQGVWVWLVTHHASRITRDTSWASRTLWTLGGAAAWVALEMVRARIFSGFPWSFLGVSQYQIVPLIQIAAFTGVYGVSFLVVWFSLALYSAARMIFQNPTKRHVWQAEIVLPMLVIVGCYIGGYFAMSRSVPAENFLRATAIQPSVPQTLIWSSSEDARRFQKLLQLSQAALDSTNNYPLTRRDATLSPTGGEGRGEGALGFKEREHVEESRIKEPRMAKTDLLVWPESAVPAIDQPTYEVINQFVQSNHVWLVLNSDDVEVHPTATNYFNAAFLIGPDGKWRLPAYHKRDLVIFGEYVPLADWLPFLRWLTPITGGWTSGDKPGTFEVERRAPSRQEDNSEAQRAETVLGAPIKISPLICFEDTFPGTTREAAQDSDILVNITNDGWFGESAEQWQHMGNSVFRAVENGLPLLRCANNGVTCLIDRHGRLEKVFRDASGSEYAKGALTVDVPVSAQKSAPTFYNRHGDWFGWSCVWIILGLLVLKIKRRRSCPDPQ